MTPQRNTRQTILASALLVAALVYALFGIADSPDSSPITNEAVSTYLFKTGQRVVVRSNITETIVQDAAVASMLELTVGKEQLIADGIDSCLVVATVYDAAGNVVSDGQPVEFSTTAGEFTSGVSTVYTLTAGGEARTWIKSPLARGANSQALVSASTYGASGRVIVRTLPVLFYAAGITGKIVSLQNRGVAGVVVAAVNASGEEAARDTVGSSGAFFIPIDRSGRYSVNFQFRTQFNDDVAVRAYASVEVPPVGGVVAVSTLNTITGILVDVGTQQPLRKSGLPVMLYRTTQDNPQSGRTLPAMQFTDARGMFLFDSLAAGDAELHVIDVRYAGKLPVAHRTPGTIVIDANLLVADTPTFEIAKASNKRIAEIGDAVQYTIEVMNTSTNVPLRNVRLVDELPSAFVFVKASGRKEGVALPEPLNNRRIEWNLADTLHPGQRIKVSYAAQIGAGGLQSAGVNRAYAVAQRVGGDTVRTAVASVQVVVRPGVFTDRGIVIGKVFYDQNENGQQDEGESGIPNVELMMEDGTRVITGDDGKYSLPEVRPGQHVIRLNQFSLPYGAVALAAKSEFAGDGASRFIRLTDGGIARSDFYVRPARQASLAVTLGAASLQTVGESTEAAYVLRFGDIGTPARITLVDTLPAGYKFDLGNITWRNTKLNTVGNLSKSLILEFPKRPSNSADTIRVPVVADSTVSGKQIRSNGKLTLAYASGKDAVFAATITYVQAKITKPEPAATPTQAEQAVKPVADHGGAPDTTKSMEFRAQTVVMDTASRRIADVQPVRAKKSKQHRSIAQDTTVHEDTVTQSSSEPETTMKRKAPQSAGSLQPKSDNDLGLLLTAGFALVVLVVLFMLYRRRRRSGEDRQ